MFSFLSHVNWTELVTSLGAVVAAITGVIRSLKGAKESTLKNGNGSKE